MYVPRGMYIFARKMRKKIISILLGCVMAMSLVACGNSDGYNSEGSSKDNQVETTENDENTESQEDGKPIKVVDMMIEYYNNPDGPSESRTVITYKYNEDYDVIEENDGASTILYEYNEYHDIISDTNGTSYEYKYDSMGNCVNKKTYYDGELEWDEYNTYDSLGNIISQELLKYFDGGDSRTYYYEYEYDGNNNLIKMTRTQPSLAWIEYTYDSDNNLILEKEFGNSEDNSIQMSVYYEYEYVDNNLVNKTEYVRDEEGNYSVEKTIEYEYDIDDFLIKEIEQYDGVYEEREYIYKMVE